MSTAVVATILASECSSIPKGIAAEEIIKQVFAKGKNYYMASTDDIAFQASIAVSYSLMSAEDKSRMEATTKVLKCLAAAMSGVPVDMEQALLEVEGIELFPLQKIWLATK